MLMDDRLDFHPGQPVGDAHPHAGIETVTLMLEGSLNDPAFGVLETGDVEWMTAGRGVIHSEDLTATGWARILQIWIALPSMMRAVAPDLQIVPLNNLPIRREPGVEVRLYSGRTGDLVSPTRNRVPVTMADFRLDTDASVAQALPGAQAGFFYVVSGSLKIGDTQLQAGDVAWFDRVEAPETELLLHAGTEGARTVLYAGTPIDEPLTHRGPFVAGSLDELAESYRGFRAGTFERLSAITRRA